MTNYLEYRSDLTNIKKLLKTGTWFYDKTVPRLIYIYSIPAEFSGSRYDDCDEFIESSPIPQTPDGLVYITSYGGEKNTLK